MLLPRVIPCLLVHRGGLVKTVGFQDPKYVGDPLNAVRIFNEKAVDELIVLDIDASAEGRPPNYRLIEHIAQECRMPLCYGGGVKSTDQAQKIFGLGVEKIAISSGAVENSGIVRAIAKEVGNQSVVAVLDVKRTVFGKYEIYVRNGKQRVKKELTEIIKDLQEEGVGEIVVNSIDRDGRMNGYDEQLVSSLIPHLHVPFTVLGGAGSIQDIVKLITNHGIIGAAAGSLFVFKGKYRAVLINYPPHSEKQKIVADALYAYRDGHKIV